MSIRMRTVAGAVVAATTALLLLSAPSTASQSAPVDGPGAGAARTTYQPTMHKVDFDLRAYKRPAPHAAMSGYCTRDWTTTVGGQCYGFGLGHDRSGGYPFDYRVEWVWHPRQGLCPSIPGGRDQEIWKYEVRLHTHGGGSAGNASFLCGWVDQNWTKMFVTDGRIALHYRASHHVVRPTERITFPGAEGSPLTVHPHPGDGGWGLKLRGYLEY